MTEAVRQELASVDEGLVCLHCPKRYRVLSIMTDKHVLCDYFGQPGCALANLRSQQAVAADLPSHLHDGEK